MTPEDWRRLLEAPDSSTPAGIRDRAMLAVLAYSACRVGELARLRVGDYKSSGGHKVLEVYGKGGKERRVPLHAEAVERLESWLDVGGNAPRQCPLPRKGASSTAAARKRARDVGSGAESHATQASPGR